MPRSQRKRSSKSPRSNPSLQSATDIPLRTKTPNNGGNESDLESSSTKSTKARSNKGSRNPVKKKLEKVLRYIKLSLRITIERLLTELYLNRMKNAKEWARKYELLRTDSALQLSKDNANGWIGI